MNAIFIHDLRIETKVGVYAWERELPQTVRVDLDIALPSTRPFETGELRDAIDYAAVVARIREFAATNSHALLERFAEAIASLILDEFGAQAVKLRIAKLGALPGVREIGVAIEREAGLSEDAFRARSALHHAHKFQAETLLLHGRHDDRASVTQAEMFSEALSDAGVPVELRIFDCGHNIPSDHSRDVLRSFLGQVFNPAVTLH